MLYCCITNAAKSKNSVEQPNDDGFWQNCFATIKSFKLRGKPISEPPNHSGA